MGLSDLIRILTTLDIEDIYNIRIEYVNSNDVDKSFEIKDI